MKYKVGDKVRIKSDLEVYGEYDGLYLYEEKCIYLGHTTKIASCDGKYYKLEIDGRAWLWSDEMLEPATMTNRQWLESLSDVEFAIEIGELATCDVIPDGVRKIAKSCKECRIAWLRAEHKEGE